MAAGRGNAAATAVLVATMRFPACSLAAAPPLQAPEVLRGEKATAASDVYSFGMVGRWVQG